MTRIFECMNCNWQTASGRFSTCFKCGCDVLLIPKNMENHLFKSVIVLVREYYEIDAILNNHENAVELYDVDTRGLLFIIKDWKDFEYFFGRYFYHRMKESE